MSDANAFAVQALAWLLTYALHSTLLLGVVWASSGLLARRSLRLEEAAWRVALCGALVTASLQLASGHAPLLGSWRLASLPSLPSSTASEHPAAERSVLRSVAVARAGATGSDSLQVGDGARPTAERLGAAGGGTSVAGSRPMNVTVHAVLGARLSAPAGAAGRPAVLRASALGAALPSGTSSARAASSRALVAAVPAAAVSGRGGFLGRLAGRLSAGSVSGLLAWLLLAAWAVVGALLAVGCIRPYWRLLRTLEGRPVVVAGGVLETLRRLMSQAGIRRPIRLSCSVRLPVPIALGLWHGEICTPPRALFHLSPEQEESLLAHELGHLARRDPLWLPLGRLLARVFFFQPLNRVACRRLHELSELLADDWAVAHTGRPLSLARCLAEVAAWTFGGARLLPVPGMTGRPSHLARRIRRLVAGAEPAGRSSWRRAPAAATLAVAVLLLGAFTIAAPGVVAGSDSRGEGTPAAPPPPPAPKAAPAPPDTPTAAEAPEAPAPPPPPPASADLPEAPAPSPAPRPAARPHPVPPALPPASAGPGAVAPLPPPAVPKRAAGARPPAPPALPAPLPPAGIPTPRALAAPPATPPPPALSEVEAENLAGYDVELGALSQQLAALESGRAISLEHLDAISADAERIGREINASITPQLELLERQLREKGTLAQLDAADMAKLQGDLARLSRIDAPSKQEMERMQEELNRALSQMPSQAEMTRAAADMARASAALDKALGNGTAADRKALEAAKADLHRALEQAAGQRRETMRQLKQELSKLKVDHAAAGAMSQEERARLTAEIRRLVEKSRPSPEQLNAIRELARNQARLSRDLSAERAEIERMRAEIRQQVESIREQARRQVSASRHGLSSDEPRPRHAPSPTPHSRPAIPAPPAPHPMDAQPAPPAPGHIPPPPPPAGAPAPPRPGHPTPPSPPAGAPDSPSPADAPPPPPTAPGR